MLRVYMHKYDEPVSVSSLMADVEAGFMQTQFEVTPEASAIVREIERGTLIDKGHFVDRFGVTLYTLSLSTGTKAALCTLFNSDKVISLDECGHNVFEAIIKHCKNGNILYHYPSIGFESEDMPIDVVTCGYRFTSLARLGAFMHGEPLNAPDMTQKGIELWNSR